MSCIACCVFADQQIPSVGNFNDLDVEVLCSHVRQAPQYTLAAVKQGVYIIGMKDQFNIHDLPRHPMRDSVQYIQDEMGFVLFDKSVGRAGNSLDNFGPYFVEQYILMEVLSKQEVAQNVMDYYVNHKEKLEQALQGYNETQGKGFICWRFINDHRTQRRRSRDKGTPTSPRSPAITGNIACPAASLLTGCLGIGLDEPGAPELDLC